MAKNKQTITTILKEKNMVIYYVDSGSETDKSKYMAYKKAGFEGTKEDCLELFEKDHIKRRLEKYKKHAGTLQIQNKGFTKFKITEGLAKVIEKGLEKGLYITRIIMEVPISMDTYKRYLIQGEKDCDEGNISTDFAKFYRRMCLANEKYEQTILERIEKAGKGGSEIHEIKEEIDKEGNVRRTTTIKKVAPNWQADAWLLERRMPHKYSRRIIREDENNDENIVEDIKKAIKAFVDCIPSDPKK